jgi:LacI family transcriptional regulator
MGFDGLDLTEMTTPQLASVYQSPYQLGATAAQLALDRLKDKNSPARKILLKTELRIRESVAPPPRAEVLMPRSARRAIGIPARV